MSGFVLVARRDGAPLAADVLDAPLRSLEHRGPDGCGVWRGPKDRPWAALGAQHFQTLPEAQTPGPTVDETGVAALLFDGRLDDRESLRAALDLPPDLCDAALVLAALRRWGRDALPRLYGSWALAYCDLEARTVLLARDPLGNRTLFYRVSRNRLAVASEAHAVLAVDGVSRAAAPLDEARLAAYFAVSDLAADRTFFASVREPAPGSSLEVGPTKERLDRFWRFDPVSRLPRRSLVEDAEQFSELLRRAVVARLRRPEGERPAALLSGGLDSSSVVALAAEQLGDRELRTITWGFERFPDCDERDWARRVLERHPCQASEIFVDEDGPLRDALDWPLDPSTPESNPFTRLFIRTWDAAEAAGSRVVLHGGFADHLYNGADRWRPDRGFQDLLWFLRRQGGRDFWRRGPRAWLRRRLKGPAPLPVPSWLTPEAKAAAPREIHPPEAEECRRPAQGRRVLGLLVAHSAVANQGLHHRCGIELRSPYRDLRLIDWFLRLPPDRLFHRGLYKRVAREALRDLLPEDVLRPRRPVSLTPVYHAGLEKARPLLRELIRSSEPELTRWVRREWLREMLDGRAAHGREEVAFWACITFALWRRTISS